MRIVVNELVDKIAKDIEQMEEQPSVSSTILKAAEIARQYTQQRA